MEKLLLCTGNWEGSGVESFTSERIEPLSLADVGLPALFPKPVPHWKPMRCKRHDSRMNEQVSFVLPMTRDWKWMPWQERQEFIARVTQGMPKVPMLNMAKLLEELRGKEVDRRARFRTVIALVASTGGHTFSGSVEGQITEELLGSGGFGYDPVFRPMGSELSFAQMDGIGEERDQPSGHSGSAIGGLPACFAPLKTFFGDRVHHRWNLKARSSDDFRENAGTTETRCSVHFNGDHLFAGPEVVNSNHAVAVQGAIDRNRPLLDKQGHVVRYFGGEWSVSAAWYFAS